MINLIDNDCNLLNVDNVECRYSDKRVTYLFIIANVIVEFET